ncbi:C-type lectin domain family 17, member A-like [Hemitrygon akajei]|uniref:C-type lectin domain family 17, member A-like n=1 Tax=Hemitrygon akajei TaxID=2704970 RepID=UPI003BF9F0A9
MDDGKTYVNMKFAKTGPQSPSNAEPDVSYVELNLRTTSVPRDRSGGAAQERKSKVKIGNRPYRQICLLCVVTSALIVTVTGLSIHVSQIRQSEETCHRNYHELNSTLQSKISRLNSNLSVLKQMHSELREFCELLTSRREQVCYQNWIRNENRSYFISTFNISYDEAKQYCSNSDSKLLEINSAEEENFVDKAVRDQGSSYWIRKCKDG